MSTLKARIMEEVKAAMKAHQAERLGTLRLLNAAIKQKEVDERRELSDDDILAIIEKQIKQRKESIAAYEKAGRQDTADAEKAEMAVLSEFLPEQASPEEVNAIIEQVLAELTASGVTGGAAMGKAMALIKPKLQGRADMASISKLLKEKLM